MQFSEFGFIKSRFSNKFPIKIYSKIEEINMFEQERPLRLSINDFLSAIAASKWEQNKNITYISILAMVNNQNTLGWFTPL